MLPEQNVSYSQGIPSSEKAKITCPEGAIIYGAAPPVGYELRCAKEQLRYGEPIKHGPSIIWHDNGKKWEESGYWDGLPHGLTTYWYENGQKEFTLTWNHGKKEGHTIGWYSIGHKKYEGDYVDDRVNGKWYFYDKKGKLTSIAIFDMDKEISRQIMK
jgi:antitoxin component YwqK of YwqJK toxin-antitoxin module